MTLRNPRNASGGNGLFYWLVQHWLRLVILGLVLYVGLPFAAPVLMHVGAEGPARLIYTLYSPLCHQLGFRSWFLFGAQTAYPLRAAGVGGVGAFEDYALQDPVYAAEFATYRDAAAQTEGVKDPERAAFLQTGRAFIGNAQMGYKVALCERDVAIYAALLAGALLFARLRDRLRPVPIWLYLLLGIAPIGLDGFSQLLSDPQLGLWPLRESTPLFRALTGALFGLMNAWLAFPYIEITMREARRDMEARQAQAADVAAARARSRERLEAWAGEAGPRHDAEAEE